jgi:hypothetical protein
MFFIGIFGIEDKDKHIGTCNNIVCFSCERFARYEVYKSYRYFHIFFIPVFKWNVKYHVKASCCGCIYELDPAIGKEFERNPDTEIRRENLWQVNNDMPFKYCSHCRTDVPAEFNYCPYCGGKL